MSDQATQATLFPRPDQILPHGRAFLFVDEIVSFEKQSLRAIRHVPLVEPWTTAHFPGNAIVPGVILVEGMAQTAGLYARLATAAEDKPPRQGLLASVRSARFIRPVKPGSTLLYQATLVARQGELFAFKTAAFVFDTLVAEAELTFSVPPM